MKILLIGADRYLWQKIRLLREGDDVVLSDAHQGGFDRIIYDLDSADARIPEGAITVSRRLPSDLSLPFCEGELTAALSGGGEGRLKIKESSSEALLDGERIPLTEGECKLLSALMRRRGYTPRAQLLSEVFGEDKSAGLLTLYIHYLREKLEVRGEKIILSSRSEGYKISERFLGGEADAAAD